MDARHGLEEFAIALAEADPVLVFVVAFQGRDLDFLFGNLRGHGEGPEILRALHRAAGHIGNGP